MKSTTKKFLTHGAFVALVAVLTLAVGPLHAAGDVCDGQEQLGTCPPFNDGSCDAACVLAGFPDGGNCVGICCTCFLR